MPPHAGAARSLLPGLIKLGALILLVITANFAAGWIVESLNLEIRPSNEEIVHRMIMISATAYAVLIAIPFVPGVEIGLALIAMLGPGIVFLVYLSTLAGLTLSFLLGRLLPLAALSQFLEELRLHRASRLLRTIEPMDRGARLSLLLSRAPNRFLPFLVRHRYLALALVVNLPGNIVIGGGGGIAMMAGASRLYSAPAFLATIALAVAPVPLAILIFGKQVLAG